MKASNKTNIQALPWKPLPGHYRGYIIMDYPLTLFINSADLTNFCFKTRVPYLSESFLALEGFGLPQQLLISVNQLNFKQYSQTCDKDHLQIKTIL